MIACRIVRQHKRDCINHLSKVSVMASLNKVLLIGNLGKDPEMKYMPNGDAVCNFSVATTETWKDKNTGEKNEVTEWHRVVIFRKLAEIAGQYLKKGSQVYIDGTLKTRKWQDKEGVERYITEIVCDEMKMLGGKSAGQSKGESQRPANSPATPTGRPSVGNFDDLENDIPF